MCVNYLVNHVENVHETFYLLTSIFVLVVYSVIFFVDFDLFACCWSSDVCSKHIRAYDIALSDEEPDGSNMQKNSFYFWRYVVPTFRFLLLIWGVVHPHWSFCLLL